MAATQRTKDQAERKATVKALYAPVEAAKLAIVEAKRRAEEAHVAHIAAVRRSGDVQTAWRAWQDAMRALDAARRTYQDALVTYHQAKAASTGQ